MVSYQDKIDGIVRKGRGLGFFGDDNDKLRELKDKKDTEGKAKIKEQQAKTDVMGKVTYSQIPVGLYTVEVTGNDEFMASRREVNIVNDEDKDEVIVYIGMKAKSETCIEF